MRETNEIYVHLVPAQTAHEPRVRLTVRFNDYVTMSHIWKEELVSNYALTVGAG